MKALRIGSLVALVVLLSFGVGAPQSSTCCVWYTNGAQLNPTAGQVMADTGPLDVFGDPAVGYYQFRIVASGTIMATFDIEHRNAANTATINSQQVRLLASGTQEVGPLVVQIVTQGERFRVVMVNGVLGTVQASIFRQ